MILSVINQGQTLQLKSTQKQAMELEYQQKGQMGIVDPDQPQSSADKDVGEYTKTIASGKKFIDKDFERDIQLQKENSDTVNSPFFMALTKEEIVEAKR